MSIDTILGISGLFIGILGLLAAYIFYRKGMRDKEPYYSIVSRNLIQDNLGKMNDLEILYKRHKVENLTTSKIVFGNSGKDTIDRLDIVKSHPLKIVSSTNTAILDAKIIGTNHPTSKFRIALSKDGSKVNLGFEYIDQGQWVLIQLVHTGQSSENLKLKGEIKGVKKIKEVKGGRLDSWQSVGAMLLFGGASTLLLFAFLGKNTTAVVLLSVLLNFSLIYLAITLLKELAKYRDAIDKTGDIFGVEMEPLVPPDPRARIVWRINSESD